MRRHISSSAFAGCAALVGGEASGCGEEASANTTLQTSYCDRQGNSRKRIVSDLATAVAPPPPPSANESEKAILSSLKLLMEVERLSRTSSDHLALIDESDFSFQSQVWRERVSQWCYDVLDFLQESREVAYVALNILDRFLAVQKNEATPYLHQPIGQFDYEVVAFTALFLAVRVSGSNRELQIPELLQLSSSGAQVRHILSAGNIMIEKLSWDHRILTPHMFLNGLMELLVNSCPGITEDRALTVQDFASYLVEISVFDHHFARISPSEIAFVALALAMTCDSELASSQQASFSLFLQTVWEETSMDIESSRLKSILSRLLVVYNQSQEGVESVASNGRCVHKGGTNYVNNNDKTSQPHIISTDEEEENCIVNEFLSNHPLHYQVHDFMHVAETRPPTRPISPLFRDRHQ